MNRFFTLLLLSSAFAIAVWNAGASGRGGSALAQGAGRFSDPLVLKNFTLIDGNGGRPLENAALVAEGGRIAWVGPASQLKVPAGATAEDLAGKFVMPGIIDLHVHIS